MAASALTSAVERVRERFQDAVTEVIEFRGDTTVVVAPARLRDICRFLRDHEPVPFNFLSDVCGADFPDREKRFEVTYTLYSISARQRLRLKVRLAAADPPLPSLVSVWPTANWHEREVFDLFGVRFDGHPDLRRILMPEDWDGHPLRKDYPIMGYGQREWYDRQRRAQGAS